MLQWMHLQNNGAAKCQEKLTVEYAAIRSAIRSEAERWFTTHLDEEMKSSG